MKKIILCVATIAAISLYSCNNKTKKDNNNLTNSTELLAVNNITFGVRGNCGMCKSTIEEAAKGVDGVSKADWNVKEKYIDVSFDSSKTNEMAIHNAIAASGYDTEKVMGSKEAYDKLPSCCKYDHEMKMKQSGNKTKEMALQDYKLDIKGMMCGMCSGKTAAELRELPWIKDLKVSHDDNYATFNVVSGSKINETTLATIIRDIGFKPENLIFKGEVINDIAKVKSNPKNTKYIYRMQAFKILDDANFNKITEKLKKIDSKIETVYNQDYEYAQIYTNTKIPFIALHETAIDAGYLPVKMSVNEDNWIKDDVIEKEKLKNYIISRVNFKNYNFDDDDKVKAAVDLIFKPKMHRFTNNGIKLYNETPITLVFAKIEKELQAKFPNLSELQIGDKSKKYDAF